jgi:pilus assembly protein CpaB
MNTRTIIFAVVALLVAVGTAVLIQNWMANQQAQMRAMIPKPQAPPTGTRILVAKRNLPMGTLLKPTDMEWQTWPPGRLSQAYMVEGQKSIDTVVGAVVRNTITAGEPVTEGQVVKPGQRGYLAAVLTPGRRAITVPINATSGIAGFIFPGDRVDILVSHRAKKGKATVRASETVLENVRVLAVDQHLENPKGKASVGKTATLEVTPRQAEIITVARSLGGLSMSLRGLRQEEGAPPLEDEDGEVVAGHRGRTLTRDSDVSRLIQSNDDANMTVVNIVHGKKTVVRKFRGIVQ